MIDAESYFADVEDRLDRESEYEADYEDEDEYIKAMFEDEKTERLLAEALGLDITQSMIPRDKVLVALGEVCCRSKTCDGAHDTITEYLRECYRDGKL